MTSQVGLKICAKHPRRMTSAAIDDHRPRGSSPRLAPNAIVLQSTTNGKVLVERTDREPFASHDATFIDISTLRRKYWDPLIMASYENGFSDRYSQYKDCSATVLVGEPWEGWRPHGLRCFINEGERRRGDRIYYLPRRSVLQGTAANTPSLAPDVQGQAKLLEVYADLAKLEPDPPLAVIFDQEDWDHSASAHPPALRALFS